MELSIIVSIILGIIAIITSIIVTIYQEKLKNKIEDIRVWYLRLFDKKKSGSKRILFIGAGELGKNSALIIREYFSNKIELLGIDRYEQPAGWGVFNEIKKIPQKEWGRKPGNKKIIKYIKVKKPEFILPELEIAPDIFKEIQEKIKINIRPSLKIIQLLLDKIKFREEFKKILHQNKKMGNTLKQPNFTTASLNEEIINSRIMDLGGFENGKKYVLKPPVSCLGAGQCVIDHERWIKPAILELKRYSRVYPSQVLIEEYIEGEIDKNKTEIFQMIIKSGDEIKVYEPIEYYRIWYKTKKKKDLSIGINRAYNLGESWHPSTLPKKIKKCIKNLSVSIVSDILKEDSFYGIEYIVNWNTTTQKSNIKYNIYLNEITFRPDDMAMLSKYSQIHSEFDMYIRLNFGIHLPDIETAIPTVCHTIIYKETEDTRLGYVEIISGIKDSYKEHTLILDINGQKINMIVESWCEFFDKTEPYFGARVGMIYVREKSLSNKSYQREKYLSHRIKAMRKLASEINKEVQPYINFKQEDKLK